jgi:hypothetical protein
MPIVSTRFDRRHYPGLREDQVGGGCNESRKQNEYAEFEGISSTISMLDLSNDTWSISLSSATSGGD